MRRKSSRTKGKIRLSRMFQELKEGEKVSIVRDLAFEAGFPKRIQGITGTIQGKRGKAYIVKIKDYNKEKTLIVKPIHLKKLK